MQLLPFFVCLVFTFLIRNQSPKILEPLLIVDKCMPSILYLNIIALSQQETELEELRAEHVSLQSELKLAQKKLQDLEGEDDDDSVICDNPYSQNGLVSKSKSRSPPKYNNGHSEKPWSFRRSRTSEAQFSSDEDDYLAGRTHRKHNSLGKNLEAPDVDGNDCDDDIVDYNGDSSKNILFEDDPELAKIRAKYIKKKVEDNVD